MAIHISVELSHVCPIDDLALHTEVLETSGFHRVWVPDTMVTPWEAWLAANMIAQQTTRIQIGVGVMNPYTRHPVVMAQMASTLQHFCGGRLALSIGSGVGWVLDKAGIEQHASAVEESISSVRSMIAGERARINGNAFRIDGVRIRIIAPEKGVPIYLAAVSMDSWETAMRVADGVVTFWNEDMVQTRKHVMADRHLPTAALVPFTLSPEGIFGQKTISAEELGACVGAMEEAGIEEMMVGYRDLVDLETIAKLIK
jgi:alkanesulfonate monooxygenase SsuD/methylene tetrahydromethanopterin reductase-like flavin-dependent oxidoreductase (luciferase family)